MDRKILAIVSLSILLLGFVILSGCIGGEKPTEGNKTTPAPTLTIPTPGEHFFNESNNNVSAPFEVLEVVKPSDLVLESLQVSKTSISPGDRITINLVVANNGEGPAEDIELDATLETVAGKYMRTINHTVLPYMAAGTKQYVNLIWNFSESLAVGNYMVKVVIDERT
jgi:hypothetical protein